MRPALLALLLVLASGVPRAHAENERAFSIGLGWATFSVPGEASGNMAPPSVSPDVGGALAFTYEHALGSDVALRGELAGGLFYGGNTDEQGALSYLGLGVPAETITWGGMVADSRETAQVAPWATIVPGAAIVLLVIALNAAGRVLTRRLVGQGWSA